MKRFVMFAVAFFFLLTQVSCSFSGSNNDLIDNDLVHNDLVALTQPVLDLCRLDSDCVVVAYSHCCGSTKKAINKAYLLEYESNKDWQSFHDPEICSRIGMCEDDFGLTKAECTSGSGVSRCRLIR